MHRILHKNQERNELKDPRPYQRCILFCVCLENHARPTWEAPIPRQSAVKKIIQSFLSSKAKMKIMISGTAIAAVMITPIVP